MQDETARQLVSMWRQRAAYFRKTAARISPTRCHDADRNLHKGLAAMADLCADDLEQRLTVEESNHAKP